MSRGRLSDTMLRAVAGTAALVVVPVLVVGHWCDALREWIRRPLDTDTEEDVLGELDDPRVW